MYSLYFARNTVYGCCTRQIVTRGKLHVIDSFPSQIFHREPIDIMHLCPYKIMKLIFLFKIKVHLKKKTNPGR